jgi:EpsD family peptidyl-prolyl cis-trans isomerase
MMNQSRAADPNQASGRARAGRVPAFLAATALALTLGACNLIGGGGKGGEGSTPSGQVVATLDGQEITTLEVNAELAGTQIPPTMDRRDAERLALNNIITRRMLVQAAEEQDLHRRPDFMLQQRRAIEQLKVQSLAREIAGRIVTPTRDEADNFIDENPQMFRERRVYILDQIQFVRPENPEQLNLEQAKTMPAVETVLTQAGVQFRRQPGSLDTLAANPAFIREVTQVLARNPQELFMFTTQPPGAPAPVVLVNQVRETRAEPFTGDRAREYAINYLRNQRIQQALQAEVEGKQGGMAARVVYQPGWEPPVQTQAGAAPAAAQGTGRATTGGTAPGAAQRTTPAAPSGPAGTPAGAPSGAPSGAPAAAPAPAPAPAPAG